MDMEPLGVRWACLAHTVDQTAQRTSLLRKLLLSGNLVAVGVLV